MVETAINLGECCLKGCNFLHLIIKYVYVVIITEIIKSDTMHTQKIRVQ